MGEASGEAIAPPQPAEAKEANSNSGLSINGSGLVALSGLYYLEEYGFYRPLPLKHNIIDKVKYLPKDLRQRPQLKKLNEIKELVLQGKNQEAKRLLQQGLALGYPVLTGEEVKKEIIEALAENISVEAAFSGNHRLNHPLRSFIRSLPGRLLSEPPTENTAILLPEMGGMGTVFPHVNRLDLEVKYVTPTYLPLDKQHPLCITENEVFGKLDKKNALSKLGLFAELSKRYGKVFTHVTHAYFLPAIFESGYIGRNYSSSGKKLYVETLSFKDASKYNEAIENIKSDKKTVKYPFS